MIGALLDGRKTMTRRVLKPQPASSGVFARLEDAKRALRWMEGDRLWVREAHAISANPDRPPAYRAGHDEARAAGPYVDVKWRPSIHMPRWASRLTLIVESVKVERLQDISLQDVRREGCEVRQFWLFGADAEERQRIGAGVFRALWESINGSDSWAGNPWVAAISFHVASANIEKLDVRGRPLCGEVAP
jgi:hypothetical protein